MKLAIALDLALAAIGTACPSLAAAQADPAREAAPAIVFCADRAGVLQPCGSCSSAVSLGGAARGGTLLAELEREQPNVVISGGNDLYGGSQGAESGAAIRDLYDVLGLDVMNLSYRDFRWGLDATVESLSSAGFQVVSANLLDASGEHLYPPFAKCSVGETKVAVLGVTMEPLGLEYLPHLEEQLAGIEFQDPLEAIREALPAARASADFVVLTAYGDVDFARLLDETFTNDVDQILIGGVTPQDLFGMGGAAPAASLPRGQGWTRTRLASGTDPEILKITPELAADERVLALIGDEPRRPSLALPPPLPERPLTEDDSLEEGATFSASSSRPGDGQGLIVRVLGARFDQRPSSAAVGGDTGQLLLDVEVENDIGAALAYAPGRGTGERLRVVQKQKLFLLYGEAGRKVAPSLRPETPSDADGHLPQDFVLEFLGDVQSGTAVFQLPKAAVESGPLELRWYHDEVPTASVGLRGALPPDETVGATKNELVEWAEPSLRLTDSLGGEAAPPGMNWAVVDFLGRALGDSPAFYLESAAHLELLESGLWPRRRIRDMEASGSDPVFLPDRFTGARAVYLVDAEAEHLALVAAFPLFVLADGTRVHPAPLRRALRGQPLDLNPSTAAIQVEDGPVRLGVHRASRVQGLGDWTAAEGRSLLVLEADLSRVESAPDARSLFGVADRFSTDGSRHLGVTDRRGRSLGDPLLLPGEATRRFCVLLDVPDTAGTAVAVQYSGVTRQTSFEVELHSGQEPPLAAAQPATDEALPADPLDEAPPPAAELGPRWKTSATKIEAPGWDLTPGTGLDAPRVSVRESGVSLTVTGASAAGARGATEAPAGEIYLVLEVEIGVEADQPPVVVDSWRGLFFGVENGQVAEEALPGAGPSDLPTYFTVEPGSAVSGQLSFLVEAESLRSFSVEFFPKGRAGLHLPVLNAANGGSMPVDTGENDSFRMQLLGFQAADAVDGEGNPTGDAELRVDLRVEHLVTSTENHVRRVPWAFEDQRIQLVIDGVHGFPAAALSGRGFTSPLWTFREATVGGQVVFDVPKELLTSATSAHLACGFQAHAHPETGLQNPSPIRLGLFGAPPESKASEWDYEVESYDSTLGIRAKGPSESFLDSRASGARTWVAFDLGYLGDPSRDAVVDPRRNVAVVTKEGRRVALHKSSWNQPTARLAKAPFWLPSGGVRRFSAAALLNSEDLEGAALEVRGLMGVDFFPLLPGGAILAPGADPQRASDGQLIHDPKRQPRGLAGVGLTGNEVNDAIQRGRDRLWELLRDEPRWWRDEQNFPAMLALHHSGAANEYPDFRRRLNEGLDAIDPRKLRNYVLGIQAMLLGEVDDPGREALVERTLRLLVEGQGPDGSWGYSPKISEALRDRLEAPRSAAQVSTSEAGREVTVELRIDGGEAPRDPARAPVPIEPTQSPLLNAGGDNSISQFAVLGLQTAQGQGYQVAERTWESALRIFDARQRLSKGEKSYGGFGYTTGGAYGSMTCAGLCSLAISLSQLDGGLDLGRDLRIRDALGWLQHNWTVEENPGSRQWHYYYLYGLERVGRLLELDFIGEHEWYPEGARFLVDSQRADGSWAGKGTEADPRIATSFALLFLTKATPSLDPNALTDAPDPSAPGFLHTRLPELPAADTIYVILDASGSMLSELDGTSRFDLAREALAQLLDSLPTGIKFGLRAYGHRKRAIEEGASEDTELLVPISPLDVASVRKAASALRPRGKTPLTLSLEKARDDLSREPSGDTKTVILLSDGGEDTRRDPRPIAELWGETKGLSLHVIGFDLSRPAWTAQLRGIAEAARGTFVEVQRGDELSAALHALALPQPPLFAVIAASGQQVAEGRFGDRVELAPGAYEMAFQWRGLEFREAFHIKPSSTVDVALSRSR